MVDLQTKTLGEILEEMNVGDYHGKLAIPDYQRIYCWPEKNVNLLLNDLLLGEHDRHPYRLGTLILQYSEGKWNIIDGQQRMVTLSLLLSELGDKTSPLLGETFRSKEAMEYVSYNLYLIKTFLQRQAWGEEKISEIISMLKSRITLDVLFLSGESLELAYTFFSAQNDRGVRLTDYELLKSHHLRYIPWEAQQMHLAKKWDNLLLIHERDGKDKAVSIVVGYYLFCLRKWSMYDECDPYADKAVKNEFEAASIIEDVPPFGESFNYNESIQGGSHFFAYVEHFVSRYPGFQRTRPYMILWSTISCSGKLTDPILDNGSHIFQNGSPRDNRKKTHYLFGDVIAALLFAYYLKFGEEYLAEALTCLTNMISKIRYDTKRANKYTILRLAGEMKIIMYLNRATSPTFFLSALKKMIMSFPCRSQQNFSPIQSDYNNLEKRLYELNSQAYILNFNSLHS